MAAGLEGFLRLAFLAVFTLPAQAVTIGTAGNAPCLTCHKTQSVPHAHTAMGNALETVKECEILKSHPRLTFQKDKYHYVITRDGDQSIYEVTRRFPNSKGPDRVGVWSRFSRSDLCVPAQRRVLRKPCQFLQSHSGFRSHDGRGCDGAARYRSGGRAVSCRHAKRSIASTATPQTRGNRGP